MLNGLLRDNGLVGVSDVLTEDDATAIQGDVIFEPNRLYVERNCIH